MYLANDVIQNSKKKGPEFGREFGNVLRKSFEAVASAGDDKTSKSLGRILNIWEERGVYDKPLIDEFRKGLSKCGFLQLLSESLFVSVTCESFLHSQ